MELQLMFEPEPPMSSGWLDLFFKPFVFSVGTPFEINLLCLIYFSNIRKMSDSNLIMEREFWKMIEIEKLVSLEI